MTAKLLEYQQASNMQSMWWACEQQALEDLRDLCSGEKRQWTCAVKRVLKGARAGWRKISTDCSVSINHTQRPYTGSLSLDVRLLFYADNQRGEIHLHGSRDKQAELLAELGRLVGQGK